MDFLGVNPGRASPKIPLPLVEAAALLTARFKCPKYYPNKE